MNKTKSLYDEISKKLHQTEQKSISGDGESRVSDTTELNKHIEELKELLIEEKKVYIVSN